MSILVPDQYPERLVDHYRFWSVSEATPSSPALSNDERAAKVQGQFNRHQPLDVSIGLIRYIANPVIKNEEARRFERTHLTAYEISGESVARRVEIWNQFDRTDGASQQIWHLARPEFLLVPAAKVRAPKVPTDNYPARPIDPVDHYLCYKVVRGPQVSRSLALTDQFRQSPRRRYDLAPAYLGVPVTKQRHPYRDPPPDLHYSEVHLAIYWLKVNNATPDDTSRVPMIVTNDQFTHPTLKVGDPSLLAVPSWKRDLGRVESVVSA
jgi:hypothetical protein